VNSDSQPAPEASVAPIVALTGFMAAGKSTIGRELACLLHWRAVDLDCEIEHRSGQRVHEIFAQHGEAHFRRLESDALRSVLADALTPTVLALGGGTFVQATNAELLRERGARVIFIELDMQKLLHRCREAVDRSQNPRPLAAQEETELRRLYEQRLPFYRLAELTVSPGDKTAWQVAREIAAALGLSAPGKQA
jgi:shikimate kinase